MVCETSILVENSNTVLTRDAFDVDGEYKLYNARGLFNSETYKAINKEDFIYFQKVTKPSSPCLL